MKLAGGYFLVAFGASLIVGGGGASQSGENGNGMSMKTTTASDGGLLWAPVAVPIDVNILRDFLKVGRLRHHRQQQVDESHGHAVFCPRYPTPTPPMRPYSTKRRPPAADAAGRIFRRNPRQHESAVIADFPHLMPGGRDYLDTTTTASFAENDFVHGERHALDLLLCGFENSLRPARPEGEHQFSDITTDDDNIGEMSKERDAYDDTIRQCTRRQLSVLTSAAADGREAAAIISPHPSSSGTELESIKNIDTIPVYNLKKDESLRTIERNSPDAETMMRNGRRPQHTDPDADDSNKTTTMLPVEPMKTTTTIINNNIGVDQHHRHHQQQQQQPSSRVLEDNNAILIQSLMMPPDVQRDLLLMAADTDAARNALPSANNKVRDEKDPSGGQ